MLEDRRKHEKGRQIGTEIAYVMPIQYKLTVCSSPLFSTSVTFYMNCGYFYISNVGVAVKTCADAYNAQPNSICFPFEAEI